MTQCFKATWCRGVGVPFGLAMGLSLLGCRADDGQSNLAGASAQVREEVCASFLQPSQQGTTDAAGSGSPSESTRKRSNLYPEPGHPIEKTELTFLPATAWLAQEGGKDETEEKILALLTPYERRSLEGFAALNASGVASLGRWECSDLPEAFEQAVKGESQLVLGMGEVSDSTEFGGLLDAEKRRACFGSDEATKRNLLGVPAVQGERANARLFAAAPRQDVIPGHGLPFEAIVEYRHIGEESLAAATGSEKPTFIGENADKACTNQKGVHLVLDSSFPAPVPIGYVAGPVAVDPLENAVDDEFMTNRCLDLSTQNRREHFPRVVLFKAVREACVRGISEKSSGASSK